MHAKVTSSSNVDQPTKLEIAHVLFTDIVGYSKLPLDHQKEVLGTLQAVVSSTPEFLRAQASGKLLTAMLHKPGSQRRRL